MFRRRQAPLRLRQLMSVCAEYGLAEPADGLPFPLPAVESRGYPGLVLSALLWFLGWVGFIQAFSPQPLARCLVHIHTTPVIHVPLYCR